MRTRPVPLLAFLLLLLLPTAGRAEDAEDGADEALAAQALRYVEAGAVATALGDLAHAAGKELAERIEYGRSAAGQALYALRLGAADRPVVLVHGGLGPRDCAGTVACLELARHIAARITERTKDVAWLLVPAPNPDGLDAFLAGRPQPGADAVDVDRDRDGARGEDGPSDVDGDGFVLRMRRASRRGTWAVQDDAPKEEAGKEPKPRGDARWLEETGQDVRREVSYEVFEEGLDDDGDGDVNEDPPGLDLRRQLAGWWENQGPWKGEGPFAGYAPEARALMRLSLGYASLLAWYGFTSEGPYVLRANAAGKVNDVDEDLYRDVAQALKARIGLETKKASTVATERDNAGCDLDWAAVHLTVPALRIPVWRIAKEERNGRDDKEVTELDWLLWNDRELKGEGFVAWKPFEHPTLGAVEIGGWKPFTRHEPPERLLGPAVAAVCEGPLVHAALRPRLEAEVEVQAQGSDAWLVTVRALNPGGAPTDTTSAVKRRRAMGVRIRFAPESDAHLLGGPREGDVGTVAAGQASQAVTWSVRKAGGGLLGRVLVRHRVAGTASARVHTP